MLDSNQSPQAYADRQLSANNGLLLTTYLRLRADQGALGTLDAFLELCGRADTAHCAFSAGSAAATRDRYDALLRRLPAQPGSAKPTYAKVVSDIGGSLSSRQGGPASPSACRRCGRPAARAARPPLSPGTARP